MQVFHLEIPRSFLRHAMIAGGTLALVSALSAEAQTPAPTEKPAVKKVEPEKKPVVEKQAPAKTEKNATDQQVSRNFARTNGINKFYDVDAGIAHLVLMEAGHVAPGDLIVGTDSHCTIYGSLGALGTGIGYTEVASVWITGKLWMKVRQKNIPSTCAVQCFRRSEALSGSNFFCIHRVIHRLCTSYAGNAKPMCTRRDLFVTHHQVPVVLHGKRVAVPKGCYFTGILC